MKKVILIKHKGQEKHKGFGFVTFSLREDAAAAADKLNGHELDGKKLLVRALALAWNARVHITPGSSTGDAAWLSGPAGGDCESQSQGRTKGS